MGFASFWTNKDVEDTPVTAPAFSLTKVMIVVTPVLTALAAGVTALVDAALSGDPWPEEPTFNTTEVTTMIVALIGFLAITGAADVLARGIAASAEKLGSSSEAAAKLAASNHVRLVKFEPPITATISGQPSGEWTYVVAASDGAGETEYLCVKPNGYTSWESASNVTISAPPR